MIFQLLVPVQVQLLDQHQRQGEGVLRNRLAVGAGCVGEHSFRSEHPRHDIGVYPGGGGLQPLEVLGRAEHVRLRLADNDICRLYLLKAYLVGSAVCKAAARACRLQLLSVPGLCGQQNEYILFHIRTLLFIRFLPDSIVAGFPRPSMSFVRIW